MNRAAAVLTQITFQTAVQFSQNSPNSAYLSRSRCPMKSTLSMQGSNGVLNSWKEVAQYLERGVRTVQRWEADLGLPVRRPRGKKRSAVIAICSEIDDWVSSCPAFLASQENGLSAQMRKII